MKAIKQRIEALEAINTPVNKIQIERIIFDSQEQSINRDKYKKVLVREDRFRKIFELIPCN